MQPRKEASLLELLVQKVVTSGAIPVGGVNCAQKSHEIHTLSLLYWSAMMDMYDTPQWG